MFIKDDQIFNHSHVIERKAGKTALVVSQPTICIKSSSTTNHKTAEPIDNITYPNVFLDDMSTYRPA